MGLLLVWVYYYFSTLFFRRSLFHKIRRRSTSTSSLIDDRSLYDTAVSVSVPPPAVVRCIVDDMRRRGCGRIDWINQLQWRWSFIFAIIVHMSVYVVVVRHGGSAPPSLPVGVERQWEGIDAIVTMSNGASIATIAMTRDVHHGKKWLVGGNWAELMELS